MANIKGVSGLSAHMTRRNLVKLTGFAGAYVAVGGLLAACGGAAADSRTASAPAVPASAPNTAKPSAAPVQSAASAAGSVSAGAASSATLKVGYSQVAVAFAPFFAAKDFGFFSKNGLDVSLQQVNGPAAVPALLAQEVQLDGLGANELTRSVLAGASLTSVATIGDLPVFMLYADKKYKSVQDLVGQTIGVTALGTSTDVTARLFLDHYGLLGKVNITAAGGTNTAVLAALTQGVIAGAIVSPEQGVLATKAGFAPIVDGVKLGVPLNFSLIGVNTTYLKDHQETVKSFLRAYQQAWSYLADAANKSAAIDLLARNMQAPADAVEVGYTAWYQVWSGQKAPTINPEGINNILKFSDDPKARAAKGEQFIDNSILQSLQP